MDSGKKAFMVLPMSYETKLSVFTYPVQKTLGLSVVTVVDEFIYLVLHVVLEECNPNAGHVCNKTNSLFQIFSRSLMMKNLQMMRYVQLGWI